VRCAKPSARAGDGSEIGGIDASLQQRGSRDVCQTVVPSATGAAMS
jgi:hypothetical protein